MEQNSELRNKFTYTGNQSSTKAPKQVIGKRNVPLTHSDGTIDTHEKNDRDPYFTLYTKII